MRDLGLEDSKAEIIERYTSGESSEDLGEAFGVSASTIVTRLREWNVEVDPVGGRYEWLDEHTEEIVERYVVKGESLQTIADDFGTTTSPIKTRLKGAGVELRPVDYSFSPEQKSVVKGELLGDGCIYRRHESACHFRLENTVRAHPAYVRELLPDGVFPSSQPYPHDRSTEWGDNTRWTIYSRGQELFDELHQDWYEQPGETRRKVVPEGFELDETAIFHWYLGDGCLSQRENGSYRLHFSTHGFPEASVERLQAELERMGYDNYTTYAKHVDSGSGLAIFISTASSKELLRLLKLRNNIEEYEYKFSPRAGL